MGENMIKQTLLFKKILLGITIILSYFFVTASVQAETIQKDQLVLLLLIILVVQRIFKQD